MKRNRKGFTLSETLTTVLLLSIVFAGITGGIAAVSDAYNKITVKSEAQALLATTVTEISQELHEAKDVSTATIEGKEFYSFYSPRRQVYVTIQNGAVEGSDGKGRNTIVVAEYNASNNTYGDSVPIRLLTEKTETSNLIARIDDVIKYDKTTNTFTMTLYVVKNSTDLKDLNVDKAIEQTELTIRPYTSDLN